MVLRWLVQTWNDRKLKQVVILSKQVVRCQSCITLKSLGNCHPWPYWLAGRDKKSEMEAPPLNRFIHEHVKRTVVNPLWNFSNGISIPVCVSHLWVKNHSSSETAAAAGGACPWWEMHSRWFTQPQSPCAKTPGSVSRPAWPWSACLGVLCLATVFIPLKDFNILPPCSNKSEYVYIYFME